MFVHINPETNAIGETISTLKFAERVASIELGAARSNKETGEIRDLKEEISNLKLALEKKEGGLEQVKGGNTRGTVDSQKARAVSPFNMPRYGTAASLKPETSQRPVDETRSFEARSCSSGKQRRSRFPSAFSDKDIIPKMPFLAEEKPMSFGKARSPSPPIRRSISTDRGALRRSKVRFEMIEDQPVMKVPFPARVPVPKSIAPIPVNPSSDNNSRGYTSSQEPAKHDDSSDAFCGLQRVPSRKVFPEHEEEQYKQALNVRQGGIRKSKVETKAKAKHHPPTRIQKFDAALTLLSDTDGGKIEESRRSDFSEPENEAGLVGSPVHSTLKVKKPPHNFSRISQNLEPRGLVQTAEPLLAAKHENKLPNGGARFVKEGSNTSMPEFRRSRSSPRGKFMMLP